MAYSAVVKLSQTNMSFNNKLNIAIPIIYKTETHLNPTKIFNLI